jgi:CheY-like chemotaxis protein
MAAGKVTESGGEPDKSSDLMSREGAKGLTRILLVDDEPAVLQVMTAILTRCGYTVTPVVKSVDALTCFVDHFGEFDCAIINQSMPLLTGIALSERILGIRPDLPIMLVTGFMNPILKQKARVKGIRTVLQKPATRQELHEAVEGLFQ